MQDKPIPLCVDLDGTLIRSDMLIESTLALVGRNPLYLLRLPIWLLRGKAVLKHEIAQRVTVDVGTLPYETRVLAWMDENNSRPRVLCTASDRSLAAAVADHVGGFDEVVATENGQNLSGKAKAEQLRKRYGDRGFDYAGNASADLHVWRHARRGILVNAGKPLARRAAERCEIERIFEPDRNRWRSWLAALRPHQWLKNLLVFLPLLTAHLLFVPHLLAAAAVAFGSFCLCASSVYIVNDLLDLEADRRHPRKCSRPFAAGSIPLAHGLFAAAALAMVAFGAAIWLSYLFALVLLGYFVTTLSYSLVLKRIAMLDTVVLAGLYTLRIIAGTIAIGVPTSYWLLAFSMFLFFSLAMIKRHTELKTMLDSGGYHSNGRGYAVDDLPLIQSLGAASGYLSVLVLALYVNSTASEALYRHPHALWLLCPLLLYWISRTWLVAHRGSMHDDPVIFALTDWVSRAVLLICGLIVVGAI